MSTLLLKAGPVPFLSEAFQAYPQRIRTDKRADLLNHIARSERLVSVCPASRLEVRPRPEMIPSGISELDAITGGIPRGYLTEICGPASSGKTSVLLAAMTVATRRAETCVLIDASDSFDPASGAAVGVDFSKLLWVRCGVSPLCAGACPERSRRVVKGFDSTKHIDPPRVSGQEKSSERKLEQVLRATDLILQSGGFGLVALDLAGIPEKFSRRIPLASWFRFQRAVEHTKTALLVVSESPRTQSCAALVIKLSAINSGCPILVSQLFGETGWGFSHAQILEGMQIEAEVVRSRLERKPMYSVQTEFKMRVVHAS